jgi:hypothetical protein
MMYSEAIYDLYNDATTVSVDEENEVYEAWDVDGNVVSINIDDMKARSALLEVAEELSRLRTERNRLLAETDYWTLSDTADATDAQLAYRIALRNIPLTYTSLNDVVWPTKP